MGLITRDDALEYHSKGRKGKIEVVSTKPCMTQRDLSLAYTPGVAEPCLDIEKDPLKAFEYTARGNLVAVISNGTAVLGLGDIGALAGKPVMEGKGVLFKRFADIDVFDIELDSKNVEDIIKCVKMLEPTFGGINLEDIKAPECFEIETRLKAEMDIPVFHDDQHGTAIISGAGLINACEIVGKKLSELKIVFSGAGASALACARHYVNLGATKENITICDTKGVIYKGRTVGMNKYKDEWAVETDARTLADAVKGADVLTGLSVKGMFTQDMIRSMADDPIVFAMANPDPEITYDEAVAARSDVIMATGRSDYPNQINNVLGFPFIFRGALDVRAKAINDEMKLAASYALAKLAKEDVPDSVIKAYGGKPFHFGREYIIPKPFDYRVLLWEAPAVARAAMETGVARHPIQDFDAYVQELENRIFRSRQVLHEIFEKAKSQPKRIVFPEGENEKIIRAAKILVDEGIANPILLGDRSKIEASLDAHRIDKDKIQIVDPASDPKHTLYIQKFHERRKRRGITPSEARTYMRMPNYFGCMMVAEGDADGMISGLTMHYPDTIRPALQVVQTREDIQKVSGLYILVLKNKIYFFADTTVINDPTAQDLAEIAKLSAEVARKFDVEPRIAMVSFSNFGSNEYPETLKVREAVKLAKELCPGVPIEGEMQADRAVTPELTKEDYPWSVIQGDANILIFPNLDAANAAYKLVWRLSNAEVIGPILMGISRPIHVLQRGVEVNDIVNMSALCVVDAQELAAKK
ncbi:MAG TPA: NADP-dependent malic enzyme [Thermoanaerobaculia bacterium]|nr:NADP-dependent malic enzyme [Thermoanaerobaculia bacterium]HUM28633.1 NADP-dependent malic enzyme [Thermoanaerobaculia bacterium]HXK66759.1 NADP-dependent malic enzyme [Thermoanaerobaculia bacterium]